MGFGGPKSKIEEEQFCSFCHGELMAKKWLDSIDKKRRSNVCDRKTVGQLDRQTKSKTKNNRLLG